jgi:D-galactose 1-dehydrogenase
VEHFSALDEMLDARPDIRAVSLCTPPQSRFDIARRALEAGRHVLLEKSPGASVAEVRALSDLARDKDLVIFATWHSRFAHAVAEARDWLKNRQIRQAEIIWKEDVRYWHPGQKWIWRAGGLGVFDPGINALSVLTEILPEPAFVTASELHFPENCETPIAARVQMRSVSGAAIGVELDWRHARTPIWDVRVETDAGTLVLSDGGARLSVDGAVRSEGPDAEYAGV